AVVPRARPEGPAVELRPLREVVALELRQELQDARAGDHRRARLPLPVHAEPLVLHRAAEAGRALAPRRLSELGSLAELARDGVLLRRAPRLVPPLARRRTRAAGRADVGAREGLAEGEARGGRGAAVGLQRAAATHSAKLVQRASWSSSPPNSER